MRGAAKKLLILIRVNFMANDAHNEISHFRLLLDCNREYVFPVVLSSAKMAMIAVMSMIQCLATLPALNQGDEIPSLGIGNSVRLLLDLYLFVVGPDEESGSVTEKVRCNPGMITLFHFTILLLLMMVTAARATAARDFIDVP
jgi:hypothetical protein